MARTLRLLTRTKKNAWANWCRAARARTKSTRSRYVGEWPLTPAQFVEWLNPHLAAEGKDTLTVWAYTNWEQARVTPQESVQNDVRAVVEKHLDDFIHNTLGKTDV